MERHESKIIEVVRVLLGLMFCLGLILAGSDGNWLPWPNFVGIGILALVAVGVNKIRGVHVE